MDYVRQAGIRDKLRTRCTRRDGLREGNRCRRAWARRSSRQGRPQAFVLRGVHARRRGPQASRGGQDRRCAKEGAEHGAAGEAHKDRRAFDGLNSRGRARLQQPLDRQGDRDLRGQYHSLSRPRRVHENGDGTARNEEGPNVPAGRWRNSSNENGGKRVASGRNHGAKTEFCLQSPRSCAGNGRCHVVRESSETRCQAHRRTLGGTAARIRKDRYGAGASRRPRRLEAGCSKDEGWGQAERQWVQALRFDHRHSPGASRVCPSFELHAAWRTQGRTQASKKTRMPTKPAHRIRTEGGRDQKETKSRISSLSWKRQKDATTGGTERQRREHRQPRSICQGS